MANPIKRAWSSKTTGVAAAAVLVLVLLVVIVALVLSFTAPAKESTQPPERTASAPASPAASSAQPSADTGCNVPAGDTSLRPKLPADLGWASLNGLSWPVSHTVGPTKTQDTYPVCFARSPLGAALSGTNFLYQSWAGDLRAATDFYAIDSPGKAALKAMPRTDNAKKLSDAGWTAAGFMVDAFTPSEAQVSVVFSTPGSQTGYTGFPLTLDWVDGDWRIKVLDSGSLWAGSPSTPVKGQFVEWRQ